MIKCKSFDEILNHLNIPAQAVEFVKTITEETPNGKYPFGEDCFVNVMNATMKPRTAHRAEAHDLYIDVQCLITGEERIYYADREGLPLETPYNPEKDVCFYSYEEMPCVDFAAGEAVILDTTEAHHPGCAVGEETTEKKAVMKVRKKA